MFNTREPSHIIQRSECLVYSHNFWSRGMLSVWVGLGLSTLEGSQNYRHLGEDTSFFKS